MLATRLKIPRDGLDEPWILGKRAVLEVPMILRLALFSAVIASCLAQTNTATISGIVTDAQGGLIGGSDVIAADDATGVRTAVKTNNSGFYSIPNLPAGGYTLAVEKEGFRRYVRGGIILTTSQVLELNAALELGAINET